MKNKERNASFELLRIITMFMVIMLHALGKGGALVSVTGSNPNAVISWLLESICINAVNVYVLISGYFLVNARFKSSRLTELVLQVMFYSILGLIIGLVTGLIPVTTVGSYELVSYLFPIHSDEYWFVTKYIIMYLFSPVLALAARKMTQKQLSYTIMGLVLYESIIKSLAPIVFVADKRGYDPLWFLVLFLIAAYIRLYGIKFLDTKKKSFRLFFGAVMLIFLQQIVIDLLNAKTGHFAELLKVTFDYNHIWGLLASIGLFMLVVNQKPLTSQEHPRLCRIICALSPMTLGVYLFHENPAIRFRWTEFFGINEAFLGNAFVFVLVLMGSCLAIYIIGTAFDYVRKILFDMLGKVFYRGKIYEALNRFDGVINGDN